MSSDIVDKNSNNGDNNNNKTKWTLFTFYCGTLRFGMIATNLLHVNDIMVVLHRLFTVFFGCRFSKFLFYRLHFILNVENRCTQAMSKFNAQFLNRLLSDHIQWKSIKSQSISTSMYIACLYSMFKVIKQSQILLLLKRIVEKWDQTYIINWKCMHTPSCWTNRMDLRMAALNIRIYNKKFCGKYRIQYV